MTEINPRSDVGLTHIALTVSNLQQSIDFYAKYAAMQVVHQRIDAESSVPVVWLSDLTRPFVIVLMQTNKVEAVLAPMAHLGVGCDSRERVDQLCEMAAQDGYLAQAPQDFGYPVGYWAFLKDPDGHTLELSYGQEVGFTVAQNTSKSAHDDD
jgi:catechol 2,3-dioxygenase-like lactoylglutathione lyase family enzyme